VVRVRKRQERNVKNPWNEVHGGETTKRDQWEHRRDITPINGGSVVFHRKESLQPRLGNERKPAGKTREEKQNTREKDGTTFED